MNSRRIRLTDPADVLLVKEIDLLEWDSFLWDNGVIRVQTSQHFDAKTEESLGDVAVDSEALELLRGRAGDSLLTNRKICEKVRLGFPGRELSVCP